MTNRSFPIRAVGVLAIVLAGSLLVHCGGKGSSASPPATAPAATTPGAEPSPEPPAAAVGTSEPAPEPSPSASAAAGATPGPQLSATASPSPTPDPAEAQRAEKERQTRSELTAAKAKADTMSAAYNAECPDLKPGELRHPGAVSRCAQLHRDAEQAISQYEALKSQARAAGIVVQ